MLLSSFIIMLKDFAFFIEKIYLFIMEGSNMFDKIIFLFIK